MRHSRTTNTESRKRKADYSRALVDTPHPVEHEYEYENYANASGEHGDVPGLFVGEQPGHPNGVHLNLIKRVLLPAEVFGDSGKVGNDISI